MRLRRLCSERMICSEEVLSMSAGTKLPTHLDLPDTDGKPVENELEHPQGTLLTQSILPVLEKIHPDGRFFVGNDVGFYWRLTEPVLDGAKSPDWSYVPG